MSQDDAVTAVQIDSLRLPARAVRLRRVLRFRDRTGDHSVALSGTMVIGSSERADVVIADPTVSRLHAELEVKEDGVWLRDLGSRNGTFVRDMRVLHCRLPEQAELRVGSTVLVLDSSDGEDEVELWPSEKLGGLVGRSAAMRELFRRITRIARSDSTILIEGETGTGKELIAREIHEHSARAGGPYVIVDCAALPEASLESELFGHVSGAFPGATAEREGAVEAAHTGTLFLDGVGELPLSVQPKLLRLLESRSLRRVGEVRERPVDVRVISATFRDLKEMVNAGAFREDLYFRLAVVPLRVPPLRDRREDIPALIRHFLPEGRFSEMDAELLKELSQRPWLGNVRELRNFVERVLALGREEALSLDAPSVRAGAEVSVDLDAPYKELRERWLGHLEREYISGLLARHNRNLSEVAQAAGLDRSYVHRLVRKHGL